MCAWFATVDSIPNLDSCTHTADDKNVSLYVSESELDKNCPRRKDNGSKCFIQLKIEGDKNVKFSIGFTYNDHPFQLAKHTVVTGPMITHANVQINFIYHCEVNQPAVVFFNSKGRDLKFFTKLVRGDAFDDENSMNFPSASSYDLENQKKNGYITNAIYSEASISKFGSSPEILITVKSAQSEEAMFDPMHYFVLQISTDSHEILRTQTHVEAVAEDVWNYYTFYNNGNSNSLRIYVSTLVMSRLEVLLSRGLQSRPPFTNKPLTSKVGLGNVDLILIPSDLKIDAHSSKDKLKGHYTLAVKSSVACNLNVFWNNKQDLNYIEITPNIPSSMTLEKSRSFYFSFYVQDTTNPTKDKGIISIYIKTDVKASVYMLKTNGELKSPDPSNNMWRTELPNFGGITVIQIKPTDANYCTECLIMGSIESNDEGHVTILSNIRHSGSAIQLTPGFTFPEILYPREKLLFKITNEDSDQIDLSLSMLSGYISIYISSFPEISETKFDESYNLEKTLDSHKFISIVPSKYNIFSPHDFYILAVNDRIESASFTMTVDKNKIRSPIEPGITKFLHLGPGEATDFIYTPKQTENFFEVRMELKQVYDEKYIEIAFENLRNFLALYHVNENGDRFLMKLRKQSITDNKIFFSFDISQNTKGTFAIHLSNVISCPVSIAVDLLNGNYKLINFNQFAVDQLRKGGNIIYEGYGDQSKLVVVDLKICHGDVEVEYFQSDLNNIDKENTTTFKKIVDKNSLASLIKLDHERLFLRIKNKVDTKSVYQINVFTEKDLENNPYSLVEEGNNGKVDVELDNNSVSFAPISIKSSYSNDFYHVVNYTLVISNDKNVLNYGKNCGNHMIDQIWKDYHLLMFSTSTIFKTMEEIERFNQTIRIKVDGMRTDTRYYGIVVARIDLFPKEGGYLSPTRSGKVYYDDFVFITAKYDIPIIFIISILISLAFFTFLFCCIKAYIFGGINQFQNFEKLVDMSGFDEGIVGMNIISAFDREYYKEKLGSTVEMTNKEPEIVEEEMQKDANN